MRTQFVANVSHELKTPLTSIKGFAETLKFVEDTETRDKFLDIIDKESERLRRLINDILILSNIESRSSEDNRILSRGSNRRCFKYFKDHAKKKNIKLIYHSNNNDKLLGHNDKFLQLVINLVENAIKYSECDKEVLIESSSDDEYYTFRVEDNG